MPASYSMESWSLILPWKLMAVSEESGMRRGGVVAAQKSGGAAIFI
jgi:hypothetical protein